MKKLFFTIALFGAFISANAQVDKQGKRDFLTNFGIVAFTVVTQNLYNASFPMGEVKVDGAAEKQYSNAGFLVPINMNGISKRRNWHIGMLVTKIGLVKEEEVEVDLDLNLDYISKSVGFFRDNQLYNYAGFFLSPTLSLNGGVKISEKVSFGLQGDVGYDIDLKKLSKIQNINGVVSEKEKIFNNSFRYSLGMSMHFFKFLYVGIGYTSNFGNLFKDPNINYTYKAITTKAGFSAIF